MQTQTVSFATDLSHLGRTNKTSCTHLAASGQPAGERSGGRRGVRVGTSGSGRAFDCDSELLSLVLRGCVGWSGPWSGRSGPHRACALGASSAALQRAGWTE